MNENNNKIEKCIEKKEIQSKPPIRNETYWGGGKEYGENGLLHNRSKNIDPSV